MGSVLIVTGVSQYLGARAAAELQAEPGVSRVIGVDWERPEHSLGGAGFAFAELHGDSVGRLIRDSGADTVVHLGLAAPDAPTGTAGASDSATGTMQVLAACQSSESVRRLVVGSDATAADGPHPRDPEGTAAAGERPYSAGADGAAGVERYTRGLTRRRPDISVAVLRFANVVGPSVESPLRHYLDRRIVPTVRDFDPYMRFIHEDDGVEAVRRTALGDRAGVFDIAAAGAMSLSQCLRRAGRSGVAVPERGLRVLGGLSRRARAAYSPERLRSLCCEHTVDATKAERALGWTPTYTSQEAFDAFLAQRGASGALPVPAPGAAGVAWSPAGGN
ncbi:UDP-glucose 4-epimerase [Haloactinospora alba]|uniref:UDP-glucose 4-epimerase n=1 Tax=Haloactinospora alba TaxID=405555 RepID=A0A543N6U6_9ACTN|nr:NAD-dependent epimerase/dehydratase family protein [Haloactinospora alba]TQN27565.1 UDP-glucose 4-epimerase [Haloactinospora alba]